MTPESIRYIIVDDNEIDRLIVEQLAEGYTQLKNCGSFDDPLEAISAIRAIQPDLVFLDIEMPQATGIELLKAVRDMVPMAVFITSFPEFALEGFELSALDYILKPLTEERFAQSVKRIGEYWEMKTKSLAYDISVEQETITIKLGHDQMKLQLKDIIYLEAMNDYTKLVLNSKQFVTLVSLSRFLEQLPTNHFIQIHRSYAATISKIEKLGNQKVVMCNDIELPVSKSYRKDLRTLLQ